MPSPKYKAGDFFIPNWEYWSKDQGFALITKVLKEEEGNHRFSYNFITAKTKDFEDNAFAGYFTYWWKKTGNFDTKEIKLIRLFYG